MDEVIYWYSFFWTMYLQEQKIQYIGTPVWPGFYFKIMP